MSIDPGGRHDDDLLRALRPERVHFANGALLAEEDFRAEQAYHRGRLARALAGLHGSGTIAGLDVQILPPGGEQAEIRVEPGLAIDRLGRLIELPEAACLRLAAWFAHMGHGEQDRERLEEAWRPGADPARGHLLADVFLSFAACAGRPQPAFATGAMDHLDAVQPSRLLDAAVLDLVLRPAGMDPDDKLPWQPIPTIPDDADAEQRLRSIADYKRRELWSLLRLDRQRQPPRLPRPAIDEDHEYAPGMEGSEVMLARLRLPARREADGPPLFDPDHVVTGDDEADPSARDVRNDRRLYAFSTVELALLAGL